MHVTSRGDAWAGFLTIGIPSIKRPTGHVYVLDTIQSIVNTTSPRDRDQIVIVVFLTDFDAAYKENLTATIVAVYGRYIESGLIHVVRVAREAYPPLDNLKSNFNDTKERVKWRSKQVTFSHQHNYAVLDFNSGVNGVLFITVVTGFLLIS